MVTFPQRSTGGRHAMMLAMQTREDAAPGAVIANTAYRVTTAEQVAADGAALLTHITADATPTPTATATATSTPTATATRMPPKRIYLPLVVRPWNR